MPRSMGFNVVYLPPIHPIGRTFRKGRNNAARGASRAIMAARGRSAQPKAGTSRSSSELGTLEDFKRFVAKAAKLDLSVALDIAFQVAPDHPYVREHEAWFRKRPDGTIQYAENPPKKYQDIYPFDFESEDWAAMWEELKSVFLYWIGQGVTIFRVDNPHTKAFPFWEWVIAEIKRDHPEVFFPGRSLHAAEDYVPAGQARIRPVLHLLPMAQCEAGIHRLPDRTDTYAGARILSAQSMAQHARHSHRVFADGRTPCIRHPPYCWQRHWERTMESTGRRSNCSRTGPCATEARSISTRKSMRFGTGTWSGPTACGRCITRVNEIRNTNPALQNDWSLKFHFADNDQLLCYSKESDDRANLLLMVVNLDPHHTQSGFVTLPLTSLEIPQDRGYEAEDLLSGERYLWHGPRNYVELNPSRGLRAHPEDPPQIEGGNGLRVLPLVGGRQHVRLSPLDETNTPQP